MNKKITALAILSAFALTATIASMMPTTAYAQQSSVGVGSTNNGTVGAASAATSDGTTSSAAGGPTSTACLGTTFATISACLSPSPFP